MNEPDRGSFNVLIVEEEISFSLSELCQACSSSETQLLALVDEGILEPQGQAPADWVFGGAALKQARTALRLTQDLQLGTEGAALVLDLLAENEALRSRLRQAGLL